MAGICFATFRSRGPQPPAAEARCRRALQLGYKPPIPLRLRLLANKCTVIFPRSGQPEPTQQPSAIELVRMAEAPGGTERRTETGDRSRASARKREEAVGNPERQPTPGEPTLPARAIGVGSAFLLAARQRLSRLALLSSVASVARIAERRGGQRAKRS